MMTRRGAAAALTLLLFSTASSSRAQEPTYTVTLPDKSVLRVRAEVSPLPGGGRAVRVATLPAGYAANDFSLDARVTLGADGTLYAGSAAFGPKALPELVSLTARRTPGLGDNAVFLVGVPEKRETIPFSGRLTTLPILEMAAGRLYDWARGGEQNFSVLLDVGVPAPQIVTLTLAAASPEDVELQSGKVKARRLRFDAAFPFLPEPARKGHLYIGKRGEVLRWDGLIKLKAPATKDDRTGEIRCEVEQPGELTLRETPRLDGARTIVLAVGKGDHPIVTSLTGPDLRPVSVESPFFGRPFKAAVVGTELRYTLAATEPKPTDVPGGRAWFPPLFFATGEWEKAGPFAGLEPGSAARDGVYFPLFTGQQEGNPFTLERLDDARTNGPSGPVTVRRYRMTTKVTHALYTDGERLLAMLTSDGTRIVRQGWEAYAEQQKAPPPPPPPPTLAPAPAADPAAQGTPP